MSDNRDELIARRIKALNELKCVRNKILADFGHTCLVELEGLQSIYKIFSDNVDELVAWSREENYPEFKMPPETIANMEKADSYFLELLRRIHNALGSITSYMDQSKRIMNKIAALNAQFSREYTAKVKEKFIDDPLTHFLKRFRNYIHHFDLVDYFVHHHYDWRKGGYQSRIIIDTHNLKKWKYWGSLGRKYLESLDRTEISILEQFDEFRNKLLRFRIWYTEQFNKYFSSELEVTNRLYDEHERLVAIGYEEHIKNFGYSEEMKIPRSRGRYFHTANLPPR